MIMSPKDSKQFYSLFQTLTGYIENKDELGSIVGYSVIGSLINFETNSGSFQEINFEQVKSVYRGIENVISACEKEDEIAHPIGFSVYCELRTIVDPFLNEKIEEHPTMSEVHEKYFLGEIIKSLSNRRGNYQDHLRREGLALLVDIQMSGSIAGRRNSLLSDFQKMRYNFTGKK